MAKGSPGIAGFSGLRVQAGLRPLLPLLILLLSAGDGQASTRPLRVGVVDDQMPCSGFEKGIPQGSAVEIWRMVADKVGVATEVTSIATPNDAVRAAAEGRIDVAVSCLNMTPHRLEQVAFAAPYTEDGMALLTRRKEHKFVDIFANLATNSVIRDMTIMLFATAFLGAILLWILSRRFDHKDIVGENSLHTFFKGWMMLVIGSGIYKMGTAPPSMSVVAVSNFVRTVLMAIFVGTTTTLVMKSDQLSISNEDTLHKALLGGVGVDGGTISQTWLEHRADGILDTQQQLRLITPLKGDQQMIKALEAGWVGSIMADSSRVTYLHHLMKQAGHYEQSKENFNSTPQGFILGSNLDPATAKSLNVTLSSLQFDGLIDEVLRRWEPESVK